MPSGAVRRRRPVGQDAHGAGLPVEAAAAGVEGFERLPATGTDGGNDDLTRGPELAVGDTVIDPVRPFPARTSLFSSTRRVLPDSVTFGVPSGTGVLAPTWACVPKSVRSFQALTERCSSMPAAVPGAGAGLSARTLNPHCPNALRPTTVGAAPESPNCVAGRLLKQIRFRPTRLLPNSLPSGSLVVLPMNVTLRATWSRNEPTQQVCKPMTLRLPPIELSSKSVYWGSRLLPGSGRRPRTRAREWGW